MNKKVDWSKYYKKGSHPTRSCCYPKPKTHALLIAYARTNLESKSKTMEKIVELFFSAFTHGERESLLKRFRAMEANEKKYPRSEKTLQ